MVSDVRKNTRKWWSLSLRNAQWECYYNSVVGESKMNILSKMRQLLASIGLFCSTPRTFGLQRFSKCEAGWWTKKNNGTFSRKCFVPTITRSNLIWPPLIHQAVKNLLNFIWNQMNFDNFDNERLQFLHGINLFYEKFVSLSHWCSFSPLVM